MSKEEKKTVNPVQDDVRAKIAEYGADENVITKVMDDLGVESLDDLASLEVADLTAIGMKLAKARKLVADMKNEAKSTSASAATAAETRAIQTQFESLLPSIPSDESWLNALAAY